MAENSEKEQCDAFRYIIGQDGRDIYNTMTFASTEVDKIEVLFTKFEDYCKPRKNVIMERYNPTQNLVQCNNSLVSTQNCQNTY